MPFGGAMLSQWERQSRASAVKFGGDIFISVNALEASLQRFVEYKSRRFGIIHYAL